MQILLIWSDHGEKDGIPPESCCWQFNGDRIPLTQSLFWLNFFSNLNSFLHLGFLQPHLRSLALSFYSFITLRPRLFASGANLSELSSLRLHSQSQQHSADRVPTEQRSVSLALLLKVIALWTILSTCCFPLCLILLDLSILSLIPWMGSQFTGARIRLGGFTSFFYLKDEPWLKGSLFIWVTLSDNVNSSVRSAVCQDDGFWLEGKR